MPKRKRSSEFTLQDRLEKHEAEIFRALKSSKGFVRQRLSKRQRDAKTTPDKAAKVEKEIAVLKSLDLHQTARAHLYSALVKVKSIAASTDLPDEIRNGVPKPDISPDEKTILHNVTSQLQGQSAVRQAVERAILAVCDALGVPTPSKGKSNAGGKQILKETDEGMKADVEDVVASTSKQPELDTGRVEAQDVTDFEGFDTNTAPDHGRVNGKMRPELEQDEYARLDELVGDSSDSVNEEEEEEEEVDFSHEKYSRFKGREQVNLDDISLSGSDGEVEITSGSESDVNTDSEPETENPPTRLSVSFTPPPRSAKVKKASRSIGRVGESAFLPTLMGGYISGSESASSIDVAPPKKRLGQQQRQAIAEKKYGTKARHLHKAAKGRKNTSDRDSQWDMRRGAVDVEEQGKRTPWKKGVGNPWEKKGRDLGKGQRERSSEKPRAERRKDDQGPLHASWEAKKKAREKATKAEFSGTKITFD